MRARRWMAVAAVLVAAAGCASDDPSGGQAVTGGTTPPEQASATASESAEAESTSPGGSDPESTGEAAQEVSLGAFGDKPQAVAAASFYEALWASYQQAEVTPSLASLTSRSALKIFRGRVQEYRSTGHTVGDLTAARIVKVEGDTVFVCMASASYQRVEAGTGAAVDPPEDGFTQYEVTMQRPRAPWKVDTIKGTKNVPCGKAAS